MKKNIIVAVLLFCGVGLFAQTWLPGTYNKNWEFTYREGETAIGTTPLNQLCLRLSNNLNSAHHLLTLENTSGSTQSAISVADALYTDNNFNVSENFQVLTNGQTFIGTSQNRTNQASGSWPHDYEGMLWVNGRIVTTEVLVETYNNWPDYVFNPKYNLRPLGDLKKFIQLNKHLPGIPSALDIQKNKGFDVGDMILRQMKVIEELTLYTIEADSKISQLEADVLKLKSLIQKTGNE